MKNKSFLISLLVFILYMLASCRTEYIPVESVRYDSIFFAKILKDSTFVKDSVFIRQKGDTVFKDKFLVVYKKVLLRDTTLAVRKDSIPVPYPVERKLSRWEQVKVNFGGYMIALGLLWIPYYILRWMIIRTRKRS